MTFDSNTAFDLECRALTRRFDHFVAVENIDLAIASGSFFSILGPSGCGKTTLLRMIAGFLAPTSGDILIKGRSVRDVPPNKRPVNMVFQHLALFPMMSVAENVGYGLRRSRRPSPASACPTSATAVSRRFPAARSNASPSPAAWSSTPTSCFSTSRSALSISSSGSI